MRTVALVLVIASCSACAPIIARNAYVDNMQNLRDISRQRAQQYSIEIGRSIEENGESKTIESAKLAVQSVLKDPDSAKFQNVRFSKYDDQPIVCGEVNAKNSYGGYTGFKQFIAGIHGAKFQEENERHPEIAAASNIGIYKACGY